MTMHATFGSFAIRARIAGWMRRRWLILREWRRRSAPRDELRMLDRRDRRDLSFLREMEAETRKWFWQP